MPTSYAADINAWTRDIARALDGFNRGARKSILRKGAAIVRKDAKSRAPVRTSGKTRKGGEKTSLNPRYSKGRIVAYYAPGNLRRSIQTLSFNRSNDIFVGPKLGAKRKATILGRTAVTADGYYAHMIYGSKKAFRARVLDPALNQNQAKVRAIIINESRARIGRGFREIRP